MLENLISKKAYLPTNCLSVFDHFVGLAFNGLNQIFIMFQILPIFFNTLTIAKQLHLLGYFKIHTDIDIHLCSKVIFPS